jgi:WSC domain
LRTSLLLLGIWITGAFAQTAPPARIVPRPLYAPLPQKTLPPRPNGALTCLVDRGQPLTPFGPLADLPSRSLNTSFTWAMQMTNDQCRATCGSQNLLLAGTQSGTFCLCGNDYFPAAPLVGNCAAPCGGYNGEICGGSQANSVSATTAYYTPPSVVPPPSQGWQCVIDMHANEYLHHEVQRWEFVAKDQNSNYTFNWSTVGGGVYHETSGTTGGTENFRRFTISGGASVVYRAIVIASNQHLLFSAQGQGRGQVDDVQLQFINWVPQLPTVKQHGSWLEYRQVLDLPMPYPTQLAFQNTIAAEGNYQGYARPAGAAGTIACSWNLTL